MAKDLWENELLTKFNLTETTVLDKHLNKIVHQIVYHLSMKTLSTRLDQTVDPSGEFYLKLFLKFSPLIQEKLVAIILEKYRAGLFANLIQNSSDQLLCIIERRSLNVIRRICVVDLLPEFVCLIEKLDNRYCYRWIEKSLEFFTKYTINSIDVKFELGQSTNGGIRLNYSNVKLLSVSTN